MLKNEPTTTKKGEERRRSLSPVGRRGQGGTHAAGAESRRRKGRRRRRRQLPRAAAAVLAAVAGGRRPGRRGPRRVRLRQRRQQPLQRPRLHAAAHHRGPKFVQVRASSPACMRQCACDFSNSLMNLSRIFLPPKLLNQNYSIPHIVSLILPYSVHILYSLTTFIVFRLQYIRSSTTRLSLDRSLLKNHTTPCKSKRVRQTVLGMYRVVFFITCLFSFKKSCQLEEKASLVFSYFLLFPLHPRLFSSDST